MTEHEEQLAAMRAAIDQAVASAAELARAMAGYFNGLVAEGFTREEALVIVLAWQATIFGSQQREADDE